MGTPDIFHAMLVTQRALGRVHLWKKKKIVGTKPVKLRDWAQQPDQLPNSQCQPQWFSSPEISPDSCIPNCEYIDLWTSWFLWARKYCSSLGHYFTLFFKDHYWTQSPSYFSFAVLQMLGCALCLPITRQNKSPYSSVLHLKFHAYTQTSNACLLFTLLTFFTYLPFYLLNPAKPSKKSFSPI